MSVNEAAQPITPNNAPYCKIQVRFMLGDAIALGTGKAELLAAIAETGSIAAAGRKMGMSYRRAWLLVETMNQSFYEPLIISTKGGKHGGGAQLSTLGEQVLALFRQMLAQIQQHTEPQQQQLLALLKK
jgi:molybdate transport system regulatory protein